MAQKIRAMIVDDSAVVRQVLSAVLTQDPDIEVIGSVPDPIFAMERMKKDWPDVVVLDIEMPRMDGITFLRQLMAIRPTPVVICSTLTEKGAETTMQAMPAGAIGFVTKPTSGLRDFLAGDAGEIVRAVKAAAAGDARRMRSTTAALARPVPEPRSAEPRSAGAVAGAGALSVTTDRLIALGTSTGGTQALEFVLTRLPRLAHGMVVVQHMPEKFTAAFASRLNGLCQSEVSEATDGDRILPGRALIAPGGRQMAVERSGGQYRVRITDDPPVNRHRPSVDVLFASAAHCAGANALGVILTGMGDDGARGLLQMRSAGARTLGQDERTCVVYGMPKAALDLGAVEREVPLDAMSGAIESYARSSR